MAHADEGGGDVAMPLEVAGQIWLRLSQPMVRLMFYCVGGAPKR
jgi:hypothetical protein